MPFGKLLLVFLVFGTLLVFSMLGGRDYVVPAEQLAGFTSVELPLAFGGTDDRYAYVTVTTQGIPLRLMVDTGHFAPISITTAALDQLSVQLIGSRTHSDIVGKLYSTREFLVATLRLGELELRDVPGIENYTSPFDDDGTIGTGLLRHFNVLFDYQGGTLTLYRKDHYPEILDEPDWYVCALTAPPQFAVQFDGLDKAYSIGLDSGCGCTNVPKMSALGRALRAAFGEEEDNWVIDEYTGEVSYLYNLNRCVLDGIYDLGPTTCVVYDMPSFMGNGLMGYDFFWNNTVFFDNAKGEMWLRPARGTLEGTTE